MSDPVGLAARRAIRSGAAPLTLAAQGVEPRGVLGRPPRRMAVISMHTSPLEQPGTGDAGGMNVYIAQTAARLASLGVEVDIFTRATSSSLPPVVELAPGLKVRHVLAGPFQGLAKADLPGQMCAMAAGVLRVEASHDPGWYDLVHSHYWLSGQVGWLAAERWGVPLVHTMHTMARVKNAELAAGDEPEPLSRVIGETQVVAASDLMIANTRTEAGELVELYDADPGRVTVVNPGVDLSAFTPGAQGLARRRLGLARDEKILLFVGRVQPLKAPDVIVRAAAAMIVSDPTWRGVLRVVVLGGPSGSGLTRPTALLELAAELGIADRLTVHPLVSHGALAWWYRAADLVCVPSHSESFGLVALEAQACGTPVIAARVGGLVTALAGGHSGVLVEGHDPGQWAREMAALLGDPARLACLSAAGTAHAANFGWDATVERLLNSYGTVLPAARTYGHRGSISAG